MRSLCWCMLFYMCKILSNQYYLFPHKPLIHFLFVIIRNQLCYGTVHIQWKYISANKRQMKLSRHKRWVDKIANEKKRIYEYYRVCCLRVNYILWFNNINYHNIVSEIGLIDQFIIKVNLFLWSFTNFVQENCR